jgi:ketosteroid isomerase-like protein
MSGRPVACCAFLLVLIWPAVTPAAEPGQVVASFHEALRTGDRARALAQLAPELIVAEQGGVELGRAEYEREHLGADMEFSAATRREVASQTAGQAGDHAWIFTVSRIEGDFRGRPVALDSNETMVLKRVDGRWQIVHIHWSSADRQRPERP